ncbi:MAG: flagellar assembly protein FliW, partial [Treponema sp.]|nr:flagellar assembly protein FliW [Treponema sp.]
IVTIPSDGSDITANFLGPLVINRKNNQCMQVILSDSRWTTKFNIIEALKKKGE